MQDKPVATAIRKSRSVKPHIQQTKKEEAQTPVEVESKPTEAALLRVDACDMGKSVISVCYKSEMGKIFI